MNIVSIREHPELLDAAADYFSAKWRLERQIYHAAILDSITTQRPIPRWYLLLENTDIIGCFGLIENDFMVRKDLSPWLCALYLEETKRGQALGAKLLAHGRSEANRLGFPTLYLCTGHIGYYEKYGWIYCGKEESTMGGLERVYKISTAE